MSKKNIFYVVGNYALLFGVLCIIIPFLLVITPRSVFEWIVNIPWYMFLPVSGFVLVVIGAIILSRQSHPRTWG